MIKSAKQKAVEFAKEHCLTYEEQEAIEHMFVADSEDSGKKIRILNKKKRTAVDN